MTVHDWTRVEDSTFHHFHGAWIFALSKALNGGLLPAGYYALAEQHLARKDGDVLLGLLGPSIKGQRTLTIRHTTGHRIIALLEVLSQSNKASSGNVADFVGKVVDALRAGIHVVVLDLLPPGRHDPRGIHGAVTEALGVDGGDFPADKPLTFASYAATAPPTAYWDYLAVGDPLPATPLFLSTQRYVELPLGPTYAAAYADMPTFWREVIEEHRSRNGQ